MEELKYIEEAERIYVENENGVKVAEIEFPNMGNNRYIITHTYVDESLRGRKVAYTLVEKAIEKIEKAGGKYDATCSYAKAWIEKNKK
jgi:predicted GNAT family acetyltransferase